MSFFVDRYLFRTAARLADLAALAYEPADVIRERLYVHDWRAWSGVVPIENGSASGFVAFAGGGRHHHELAVVSIAGTNDVYDMLQNFLARGKLAIESGLWAHEGMFYHARLFLNGLFLNRGLANQLQRTERVYFTGHSLGGAVATLLPLFLENVNTQLVCTYGSPRVLSHATAGRYPYPVRRFVGMGDVIPMVPLPWRFSHVGDVRYVTTKTNGDLLAERRWGAISKWWTLLRTYGAGALWRLPRGESPVWKTIREQHALQRYQQALNKAAADFERGERSLRASTL